MKWRSPLLGILSGVLLAFAIPNELIHFGNPYIAPIALVPLFVGFILEPKRRTARLTMVFFSICSSLLIYFWLGNFLGFSIWTVTGVTAGQLFYALSVLPFLRVAATADGYKRPFLLASGWVAFEYMRSIGYIGFPWGLIAYPFGGVLPFVQIADIAGLWAVSFIVALSNSLLAESLVSALRLGPEKVIVPLPTSTQNPKLAIGRTTISAYNGNPLARAWLFFAIILCANLSYGVAAMRRDIPITKTLNAVLVQQNLDPWSGGNDRVALQRAQNLTRKGLAELDDKADIVLWSESSLRYPYIESRNYYDKYPENDPFTLFIKDISVPILVGGPYILDWDKGEALNASILIGENGEVTDYYGKQHPVPFAEHIPFYEYEVVSTFFREVVGLPAIWTMGKEYVIFRVPTQHGSTVGFGTPICFEDSFPSLNRNFVKLGAEILINITNDSWSNTVSAETQHFAAARFRTIENRRVLIRSSNSGVTAIVDPWGRIISSLPLFSEGYLAAEIPVFEPRTPTPYNVLGDYFPVAIWIGLFIYLFCIRFIPGMSENSPGIKKPAD